MIPHWKVDVGGNIVTDDSLSATVVRPINAVSYATLIANDYKGKNYLANIDLFDTLDIYMDWVNATTKVFSGIIEHVGPELSIEQGEILTAKARGLGRALLLTHCNAIYGLEGVKKDILGNPLEDPDEIWNDLVDNYVELSFGGASTGYNIGKSINVRTTPNINYLNSAYRNNFDLICEVLVMRQAEEGHSSPSDQFFVDTSGTLRIKAVDENQTGWSHYWDSETTAPIITEGETITFSGFHKTTQDFANKIVYIGGLRKPATDTWTNGPIGVASDWGDTDTTLTYDAGGGAGEPAAPIVGGTMLKAASEIDGTCHFWYPTANAGWNFTKIGSAQNPPRINFQLACDDVSDAVQIGVNLFTTRGTAYYAYVDSAAAWTLQTELTQDLEFQFISIPIGPFAMFYDRNSKYHWTKSGGVSWGNINGLEFQFDGTPDHNIIFVDDLHFSGNLIRVAYNNTSISNPNINEVQKIIVDDTAHDDTMRDTGVGNDLGTCALLAKGELMRCQTTPIVGTVTLGKGIETILPGQVIHLHGRHVSGATYRIHDNFRVTKITHTFSKQGFLTSLDVTNDVLTSFPKTVPDAASILTKYTLLGHKEAKNLKAAGIDVLVPQLSVNYPS